MNGKIPVLCFTIITLLIYCEAATNVGSSYDQTCVDDNSPAEDCFDYFKLAMTWSPGYAYKLDDTNNFDTLKTKPIQWVIHGLWPAINGLVDIPSRCTKQNLSFNESRLNNRGLKNRLNANWYTILPTNTNAQFWEHEFEIHGSCASRSQLIGNDVNYFRKTVDLFEQLDIGAALSDGGLRPGDIKTLRQIINIIRNAIGVKVKVNTYKHSITKQLYLWEIYVCYNLDLDLIDCPNADPPRYVLAKNVIYLDKYQVVS